MLFKIVLLEIFVLSVISLEDSFGATPLLQEYYLKDPNYINCTETKQNNISAILDCLVSQNVIRGNAWYCNSNETVMRKSHNYECALSSIKLESQPFFEPDYQEKLKNSAKFEFVVGNDITVHGGQRYGEELYDRHHSHQTMDLEFKICFYNASHKVLEVYSAHKKDICYQQKVALNAVYLFYDNTFFWMFIPTLIISILFTALTIAVYLYHEKWRSMYFGKCVICHSLSYMVHQLLYVHNYKYFTKKSITCFEGTLLVFQMAFQLSSYCWMSVLTYQTYISLKKFVVATICLISSLTFASLFSSTAKPDTGGLKKIIFLYLGTVTVPIWFMSTIAIISAQQEVSHEDWLKMLEAPSTLLELTTIIWIFSIFCLIWKSNRNFSNDLDSRKNVLQCSKKEK